MYTNARGETHLTSRLSACEVFGTMVLEDRRKLAEEMADAHGVQAGCIAQLIAFSVSCHIAL